MRGLEAQARVHLDRRLSRNRARPLAVALSGGGDSVALLLIADVWARETGRELVVLTVDHGLQPQSAAWTQACAVRAARLGRPFRALTWTGPKPARGGPAAARAARHRLLAEAAREAGAAVILVGHTADDVLEARRMRAAGATTPEPRIWSPSPSWPEGRDIFLLRPLLEVRRTALRAWLAARGETWIDDPANADPRSLRASVRPLAQGDDLPPLPEPAPLDLEVEERMGWLQARRATIRAGETERFLGLACVCAGGGERRPPGVRIARLAEALRSEAEVVGVLAGARIEADAEQVRIFREAGEAGRGGLAPLELPPGQPVVWDGRFELLAAAPGLTVRRLGGLSARLPKAQRVALRDIPAAARPALPTILKGEAVTCPLLETDPCVAVRSLVGRRYRAAAGLIGREPQ